MCPGRGVRHEEAITEDTSSSGFLLKKISPISAIFAKRISKGMLCALVGARVSKSAHWP